MQQRETSVTVARNAGIIVGRGESTLDRGFDGAANAAERLVIREPERAAAAIVKVKLFERKSEKRQRVAARAGLDIFEQALRQARLNREWMVGLAQPRCRSFDHGLIGAARHRQQRQGLLPYPLERLRRLQPIIGIRADRKQRDERRLIVRDEIADQRQQCLSFLRAVALEQLFCLVDGEHERRLAAFFC
jgi:hypothetical protein